MAIVTGANGLIGRSLVPLLEAQGWRVMGIGRSAAHSWDAFWQMDLQGVDAVFHLAAFVPPSMEDSTHARECLEVNTLLTLRLAEHVATRSAARLVFASTGQVYGFRDQAVCEDAIVNANGRACFYLSSKLLAESYVWHTVLHLGLNSAIVRIGNVYGPGMKPGSLIAFFCKLAREGRPLPLRHGGCERFDFIEVSDVALCLMRAAERGLNGVIHAGTGVAPSVREVAEIVNAVFENNAGIELVPPHEAPRQPGFAPLDMAHARKVLGIDPLPLRQGVQKYREWLEASS